MLHTCNALAAVALAAAVRVLLWRRCRHRSQLKQQNAQSAVISNAKLHHKQQCLHEETEYQGAPQFQEQLAAVQAERNALAQLLLEERARITNAVVDATAIAHELRALQAIITCQPCTIPQGRPAAIVAADSSTAATASNDEPSSHTLLSGRADSTLHAWGSLCSEASTTPRGISAVLLGLPGTRRSTSEQLTLSSVPPSTTDRPEYSADDMSGVMTSFAHFPAPCPAASWPWPLPPPHRQPSRLAVLRSAAGPALDSWGSGISPRHNSVDLMQLHAFAAVETDTGARVSEVDECMRGLLQRADALVTTLS